MPPPTISVSRDLQSDPARLWEMVSDVTRMPEWSPENTAAQWLGGASGPVVGARFRGTNRGGRRSWKTVCTVTESVPGQVFAFRVRAAGMDVAEWRYTFEAGAAGCTVTESWTDRRGGLLKAASPYITGVGDRAEHNRKGMEATLDRLAAAATGPH